MENTITDLLDAIIPKLDTLIGDMRTWMSLALIIGPVLFIVMGLFYLFLAPPEANHKLGYRTYFGMGSLAAWKFTQKLAGIVWSALGVVMAVVAIIGCIIMLAQAPTDASSTALVIVIMEAVAALAAFLAIEITVLIRFDINGTDRFKKKK